MTKPASMAWKNGENGFHGVETFHPVRWLRLVDSTNTLARDWALAGAPDGATVLADAQTAGRGRFANRAWHSPPGLGLYVSFIHRLPRLTAADTPSLAFAAASAVVSALDFLGVPDLSVKPPNDVLANGKKICGILLEPRTSPTGTVDFLVAGFGINILHTAADFPPPLRPTATSCLLCGIHTTPAALLTLLAPLWLSSLTPFR